MKSPIPRIGLVLFLLVSVLAAHAAPAKELPNVPNLVGMQLDKARSVLKKEGFQVKAVAKESWFPGEHLKVYRQTPRPGPLNRIGKTVTIWYFWDRTLKPGQQKAKPARPEPLKPPVVKAESPIIAAPTSPPRKAAPQEELKAKPAPGEEIVTPSVLGMGHNMAKSILERKGLRIKVANRISTSNRFLSDTIASQEPRAGLTSRQGDAVMVTVYDYLPSSVQELPGS